MRQTFTLRAHRCSRRTGRTHAPTVRQFPSPGAALCLHPHVFAFSSLSIAFFFSRSLTIQESFRCWHEDTTTVAVLIAADSGIYNAIVFGRGFSCRRIDLSSYIAAPRFVELFYIWPHRARRMYSSARAGERSSWDKEDGTLGPDDRIGSGEQHC